MYASGLIVLIFWRVESGYAISQSSLACGACSLILNELEAGITSVDSNKKIQVGSFRVDPKGDQNGLNEVSFARSEVHVYDLLDSICAKSKDYKLVINPTTGKGVYRRGDLTKIDGDKSRATLSKLESACSDFLDDHEDDVVKFVREHHEDPVRMFCHQQLGVCTSVDVTPFPDAPQTLNDNNKQPEEDSDNSNTDNNKGNEEDDKDEL